MQELKGFGSDIHRPLRPVPIGQSPAERAAKTSSAETSVAERTLYRVPSPHTVGVRAGTDGEDQQIVDQSRDIDDPHGPEDSPIFALTCPRCGTRLPTGNQSPLDGAPSRKTIICPSCGADVRLVTDPTLA